MLAKLKNTLTRLLMGVVVALGLAATLGAGSASAAPVVPAATSTLVTAAVPADSGRPDGANGYFEYYLYSQVVSRWNDANCQYRDVWAEEIRVLGQIAWRQYFYKGDPYWSACPGH